MVERLYPHPIVTTTAKRIVEEFPRGHRMPVPVGHVQLPTPAIPSNMPGLALPSDSDVPSPGVSVIGYLGGGFLGRTATTGTESWRVLYLDDELNTWLLIREEDILDHKRVDDDRSAFGYRNLVSLPRDAPVIRGEGSP